MDFHKPGAVHLYSRWILSSKDSSCLLVPIAFAGIIGIIDFTLFTSLALSILAKREGMLIQSHMPSFKGLASYVSLSGLC